MSAYYTINKGTGKTVEFKGLRSQYLTRMVIIVLGMFFFFLILHAVGVPDLISIALVAGSGLGAISHVVSANRKYGQHGLAKLQASRAIPTFILHRKSFRYLLKPEAKRHK